ncbi:MAG: AraC family transcriptional regulator [Elusimicrobia bacterium]|nr:AraC family transcriptional regulator [Elusimicrobiota bacterium]
MKLDYNWKVKKNSKLLVVDTLDPFPDWEVKKHYHSFDELVVVTRGSVRVEISGKIIQANIGDILYYPSGLQHKELNDANDQAGIIVIHWKKKGKVELPTLIHDSNKRVYSLANWACEQTNSRYIRRHLLQEKILDVIIAELTKITTYKEKHPLIDKIRVFMKNNLKEPLTLGKLANYADMSKYHFLKTYKKLIGLTPMEDLRIIRLETAKNLIITTDLPLKSIFAEVGFANKYHFSRLFKKYFNTPPGHFRKKTTFNKNTIFI